MTSAENGPATTSSSRITELLRRHPLVDGHNDLPWAARLAAGGDWTRFDLSRPQPSVHTDLPRLRAGGVGAQFWSVYVPATLGERAVAATLEQVDATTRMIERFGGVLAPARTADEVVAAHRVGWIASLLGAEGGHCLGRSLGTLRVLYELGVRYLTLTHNHNVGWADSATDVPGCGGLTAFGRAVVAEMNRLGMVVDLSHVADSTMRAALACADAPVMFSHSSARAVCDSPRNVPDDVLTTLRANGGVCMVTFVPAFVSPTVAAWCAEQVEACQAAGLDPRDATDFGSWLARVGPDQPRATLGDVVAHVEHVREVAGIDHVGLGGDYDGTDSLPDGLEDVTGYPRLLAALADRGWSDEDLVKLAGGNVLRVLRDVEAVAREESSRREPDVSSYDELDGPTTPGQ